MVAYRNYYKTIKILMHLIAELFTAIMLIIGGIGVSTVKEWGQIFTSFQWVCCFIHWLLAQSTIIKEEISGL